jgi:hypothetical protein
MMKLAIGALLSVASADRPAELRGASSPQEILEIVSKSEELIKQLPEELSGPNMTLANFEKYFDITVSYHGPALKSVAPSDAALRQIQDLQAQSNLSATVDPYDPSKIINAAAKAWEFVKNNQPVVDLVSLGDFATAAPDGVAWQNVVYGGTELTTQGQVSWVNGFGNQCAEIYYRLYWLHHGNYANDGQWYMSQITQVVDHAHAAFMVSVGAKSDTSPPALISKNGQVMSQIIMYLDMYSDGNHVLHNYVIKGDGSLQNLANPGPSPVMV